MGSYITVAHLDSPIGSSPHAIADIAKELLRLRLVSFKYLRISVKCRLETSIFVESWPSDSHIVLHDVKSGLSCTRVNSVEKLSKRLFWTHIWVDMCEPCCTVTVFHLYNFSRAMQRLKLLLSSTTHTHYIQIQIQY